MADPITTVLDEAVTRDLVSLADLKEDLAITGSADDPFLSRAISRASTEIEGYCGRVFAVERVQDDFRHHFCGHLLRVSRTPVVSVASITEGGLTLDPGNYSVNKELGILSRSSGQWSNPTIIYETGFDPIPLDIQGAATEVVKALQFNRSRDPMLRSENILSGLYAYTLFDLGASSAGVLAQVTATLDRYRRIFL